jgi:hypothetical protein
MKFCGAMELCGIGYPRSEPADYQWPDIEAQVAAQKAGLLVAITREAQPHEAELMKTKGFAAVYKFTNPRTGNVGVLWIKDFTGAGGPVTKLPEVLYIPPPSPMPETNPNSWAGLRERVRMATNAVVNYPAIDVPSIVEPPFPSWYDDGGSEFLDRPSTATYTGGVGSDSDPEPPTEPSIY